MRILQSVAAGLLGKAAYEGGAGTAALGAFLHFFIALVIAADLRRREPHVAGARAPGDALRSALRDRRLSRHELRRPPALGVPAAPGGSPAPVVWITGVLVHMFLIGLPIALAAKRAFRGAA